MIEYIIHLATVTALAVGVIPLGVFIVFDGLRDLRGTDTTSVVLINMRMIVMGLLLIGLPLMVLVDGVMK